MNPALLSAHVYTTTFVTSFGALLLTASFGRNRLPLWCTNPHLPPALMSTIRRRYYSDPATAFSQTCWTTHLYAVRCLYSRRTETAYAGV